MSLFHVVDDLPELRLVLSELIEAVGHKARAFDSAESYLAHLHSADFVAPVAILSDYDMPGLNGLELIQAVRKTRPQQKAVIVSGTPSEELNQIIHADICYYLAKPYKMKQLFALLDSLVKCESSCPFSTVEVPRRCQHGLDHPCPIASKKDASIYRP